jgi:hypothetical protein
MSLWNDIRETFTEKAEHCHHVKFPDPRAPAEATPIRPQQHYFRIWLCEMFLTNSRAWFRNEYPAVNAEVQLKFGNVARQPFTRVAGPKQNALGRGVFENYALTALLPFQGGDVEVEVGLLALKGDNSLLSTISLLEGFSKLVAAPLGQALSLAKEVSSGVETIFKSTNGDILLGFHQTYTAAGGGGTSVLTPGYVAVIGASPKQLPAAELSVVDGRLCRNEQAMTGYEYVLFRIEGRVERDDWPSDIDTPFREAQEAFEIGEKERAEAARKAAITAAFRSPDLTPIDRRRMIKAINDALDFEAGKVGHNLTDGGGKLSLATAFKRFAPKLKDVALLEEITAAEAFGG